MNRRVKSTCCISEAPQPPGEPALEERELRVLAILAGEEGGATVSFQGLRRRLDLHQQILARLLKRLERDGLVARAEAGYRLTDEGYAVLPGRIRCCRNRGAVLPFVQALLPRGVNGDRVADHLSRRWFKGLHWYGRATLPGETVLSWIVGETDHLVRVRVAENVLTMAAEVDDEDPEDAFRAARGILQALADIYGDPVVAPDRVTGRAGDAVTPPVRHHAPSGST